jgi:hypothetical protein
MDSLSQLPFPFYLCVTVAAWLLLRGWQVRMEGWGIPLMTVAVTAGIWYLMDPIYNDYEHYLKEVGSENLSKGFWEVLVFLLSLGFLAPLINQKMNGDLRGNGSQVLQMMRSKEIEQPHFQDQISRLSAALLLAWAVLMAIALVRVNYDIVGIFFPYLGEKAQPWARDRIGTGIDSLFALAGYLQIMLTALLGVTFALALRPSSMVISGIGYFLAAPFYLFDRTRNTMLAILLPGLMALVTLRIRSGMAMRVIVLLCSFVALESWMKFVIDNRDQMSMVQALKTGGTQDLTVKSRKHLGFNMFEELGFINSYIEQGTYRVNWGERYFAEVVNPIPRVLWPGKPLIGIDYAIARGMAYGDQGKKSGGVAASISTGMIGQGVVNFGGFLGPIAAALLMAVWIAVLARQDLMGRDLGHLLLYAIGLVLTYNMGRDITLLTIYPFLFGWILLKWMNRNKTTAHPDTLTHETGSLR